MRRVRRLAATLALGAALALGALPAVAWEGRSTGAGITEQAALSSALHAKLVAAGFSRGLFEPLTVPPADAPGLIEALRLLPPSDGAQPDARGQQPALSWLAAGAVLADVTPATAANLFYDVASGAGWRAPSVGLSGRVRELLGRAAIPASGMPAPDWVVSDTNAFDLGGFLDQYAKTIRAGTPGERARHLAGALVAAGAMVRALASMGSPSRVRGDGLAHLDPLGASLDDLGSRFEHLAALAYGRLGVPGPARVVTRDTLRGFFVGADPAAPGLADATAARWFSAHTLPGAVDVQRGSASAGLARPLPALPRQLGVMAATQTGGATLLDADQVCLARYHAARGTIRFTTDDACALQQLGKILPEVVAYATGLLDFLFRGQLQVTLAGAAITVAGDAAGGVIELYAEDARGVRTRLADANVPTGARRVVAMAVGRDARGEAVIAVGVADVP